jgi:hypothetical protein
LRLVLWSLLLIALGVVMWVRFLLFPSLVAGAGLDPSWMQALGHFYRTGAQAGTDYIFTYGPLGFFASAAHDPDLYWPRYVWELTVKLAAAVVITLALAGLPRRWLTLVGLVLVIAFVPYHFDTIYQVTVLAAGLLLLDGTGRSWPRAALLLPLLAVLAMTKFTYFLLALGTALLAEVAVRLRGYRGWASPALLYVTCAAAVWLLSGQRLTSLPAYLRYSWDVAAGYADAMAAPGDPFDVALATVTLLLTGILLLVAAWRNRRSAVAVSQVVLLAAGLFLGWKHGLIRHDDHAMIFFGMALFVGLWLLRLLPPSRSSGIAIGCLVACSIAGTLLTSSSLRTDLFAWSIRRTMANLTVALHPTQRQVELDERRRSQAEKWSLPGVAAIVGDATLDQLSCDQAVVLLNGFNYRPRPVFQSYTAYTPALLRLNADFFRSSAAPEYVLCSLAPVDDRLGGMEDDLALREILRRYYPVLRERQFVLLQRLPAGEEPATPEPEIVCRRTIHFGEVVNLDSLPGHYLMLALRVSPSIHGQAWGALFKRDVLRLEFHKASGAPLRRRLVPALAQEGFLVNPLVDTTADLVRLYGPPPPDRVVSFRVTPESGDYLDEIEMTLTSWPRLPCRTLTPEVVETLAPP